jgi:hypothetical protein
MYITYYLSKDLALGDDWQMVGRREIPMGLGRAAESTDTVKVTIPAIVVNDTRLYPFGAYYLVVCANADGGRGEGNVANNCLFSREKMNVTW